MQYNIDNFDIVKGDNVWVAEYYNEQTDTFSAVLSADSYESALTAIARLCNVTINN